MIEFVKIEERGGNLVAVFDRGYQVLQYYTWFGCRGGRLIESRDDGTFCLNEESLRLRIANVEREGRDASVERLALGLLAHANKLQAPPGSEEGKR